MRLALGDRRPQPRCMSGRTAARRADKGVGGGDLPVARPRAPTCAATGPPCRRTFLNTAPPERQQAQAGPETQTVSM